MKRLELRAPDWVYEYIHSEFLVRKGEDSHNTIFTEIVYDGLRSRGVGIYDGEYGILVVDFRDHRVLEDSLDRSRIWKDSGEDYDKQSYIYSEVCEALLGDKASILAPPRNGSEAWAGNRRDFGYEICLHDGWKLVIDAEETVFVAPAE